MHFSEIIKLQFEKERHTWLCIFKAFYKYRRFHGRGRHLVGGAKKSDRLGRVILFLKKMKDASSVYIYCHASFQMNCVHYRLGKRNYNIFLLISRVSTDAS